MGKCKLVKKDMFGHTRLIGECPECKDDFVLDEKVFELDSKTISCFFCKRTFFVIDLLVKRKYIDVDLVTNKKDKDKQ